MPAPTTADSTPDRTPRPHHRRDTSAPARGLPRRTSTLLATLLRSQPGPDPLHLAPLAHRLEARKLQVLGVLHNYRVQRADGTTAAERFFGATPADLFAWLLERLPLPARQNRRQKAA